MGIAQVPAAFPLAWVGHTRFEMALEFWAVCPYRVLHRAIRPGILVTFSSGPTTINTS